MMRALRPLLAAATFAALVLAPAASAESGTISMTGAGTWTFTLSRPATVTFSAADVDAPRDDAPAPVTVNLTPRNEPAWGFWLEGVDRSTARAYAGAVEQGGAWMPFDRRATVSLPRGRYAVTTFGTGKPGTVRLTLDGTRAPRLVRTAARRLDLSVATTSDSGGVRREHYKGTPRAAFLALTDRAFLSDGAKRASACLRAVEDEKCFVRHESSRQYLPMSVFAPPQRLPRDPEVEYALRGGAFSTVTVLVY